MGTICPRFQARPRGARPHSTIRGLIKVPSQSKDVGGVAGRYASALYELADSGKVLDAVAEDLRTVRSMLDECDDFARLVSSPMRRPRR